MGNQVQGWTQKVIVETFIGGLKIKIVDGISMFKRRILKEVISLARMRGDQIRIQQKFTRPSIYSMSETPTLSVTSLLKNMLVNYIF